MQARLEWVIGTAFVGDPGPFIYRLEAGKRGNDQDISYYEGVNDPRGLRDALERDVGLVFPSQRRCRRRDLDFLL